VAKPFYERPILNSPHYPPTRHHALDDKGQPLEHEPILGRRRSRYLTPVPSARRRRAAEEAELPFHTQEGQPGTYNENTIVNEIRRHVGDWRAVPNPNDWGVTPATQRLLQHWRRDDVQGCGRSFARSKRSKRRSGWPKLLGDGGNMHISFGTWRKRTGTPTLTFFASR
jgi:type III restriction enzyme